MGSANCLVHGEILGGRKSTRKLVKARQLNIPIISEEQFFLPAGTEACRAVRDIIAKLTN
jgi:hypothetical protein